MYVMKLELYEKKIDVKYKQGEYIVIFFFRFII